MQNILDFVYFFLMWNLLFYFSPVHPAKKSLVLLCYIICLGVLFIVGDNTVQRPDCSEAVDSFIYR